MDNRCIGKGCTVYFPVGAQGAYFGLGDVHGLMGDGEVCICGLEMAATVDVRVRVIPGRQEGCPIWRRTGAGRRCTPRRRWMRPRAARAMRC